MDNTLQEQLITSLLDPRSSLSPREVAAREEILWLRSQIASGNAASWNAPIPPKKAEKKPWGKGSEVTSNG